MENLATTGTAIEGLDFKLPNLLDLNKQYMTDTVRMATQSVTEGHYDAIKALVYAKKGLELFTLLEKSVRPIAEHEAKLAKGEIYSLHSVDVSSRESGVKYDYTVCGDNEWSDLKSRHDALTLELKEREEFLKKVNKTMEVVDTDSGETYTINPPLRTGKMGLTLSIK